MVDLGWRDIAALWGAVLSTLIVLTRLLPSRPRLHIEPGEPPHADLVLRIADPSKRLVIVRDRWCFRWGGATPAISLFTRGATSIAGIGTPGQLLVMVKGEDECRVMVSGLRDGARWFVVLSWRNPWLWPVSVPAFVVLSERRAKKLNTAAKGSPSDGAGADARDAAKG